MSYFPTDIPFMSEEELKANGIKVNCFMSEGELKANGAKINCSEKPNNSKLKPCPFCGGEAKLVKQTDGYKINPVHIIHSFYVKCSRCGMETKAFQSDIWQDNTGNVHIEHNGAEEAIEAWNRRVK